MDDEDVAGCGCAAVFIGVIIMLIIWGSDMQLTSTFGG